MMSENVVARLGEVFVNGPRTTSESWSTMERRAVSFVSYS